MANPYNSPHLRPPRIQDKQLYFRWANIYKHLSGFFHLEQQHGMLLVNDEFYIAKSATVMRLKSHLDWVHYDPQDLAQAMLKAQVPAYYEQQMSDPESPGDHWRDKAKEQDLKVHYAVRAGRATEI